MIRQIVQFQPLDGPFRQVLLPLPGQGGLNFLAQGQVLAGCSGIVVRFRVHVNDDVRNIRKMLFQRLVEPVRQEMSL